MKQITFRELLNLVYDEKPPKLIKYEGGVYRKYGIIDYENVINGELLSSVIGEDIPLALMAQQKIITIYDEILDDKEKEYISNIIRPFKKYVRAVSKIKIGSQEQINILYYDYFDKGEDVYSFILLPTFKKDTMYRGMESYKEYTLEELGL